MKIILTGANGFLGTVLYSQLLNKSHHVKCLVRKPWGAKNEVICDINHITKRDLINLIKGFDCIIHLAAFPYFSEQFNSDAYQTNCISTLKLIQAAKDLNIKFIYSSNALIAGKNKTFIDENTPDNPDIPYNISKYICEKTIEGELSKFTILRIGGIYGLKGPEHLYLNKAIKKALFEGIPPNLNSEGTEKRNYIYVKDLSSWIINILENDIDGKIFMAGEEILDFKSILDLVVTHCLPGQQLIKNIVKKSFDQVIIPSKPPFELHSYQEAILDIINDFKKNEDSNSL